MQGRRVMIAAVLALMLATAPPPSGRAATPQTSAMTWQVDYAAQIITVTIRLDFYAIGCAINTCTGANGELAPAIVQRIVADIEAKWNGHQFRCFQFILKVEANIVPDAGSVPSDAVGIGVFHADNWAVSWVDEGASGLQTGYWWDGAAAGEYGHEAGHLMGLDDAYQGPNGDLVPGRQPDVMWRSDQWVTDATIAEVVQANPGQVDLSKVLCDFKVDWPFGPTSTTGVKCATPVGLWNLKISGTSIPNVISGGITFKLDSGTLDGNFAYNFSIATSAGPISFTADGVVKYISAGPGKGGNLEVRAQDVVGNWRLLGGKGGGPFAPGETVTIPVTQLSDPSCQGT